MILACLLNWPSHDSNDRLTLFFMYSTVNYSLAGRTVLHDVVSTIEACTTSASAHGYRFTDDHFIILVERGCFGLSFGGKVYFIKKGEMALITRGVYIEYWNATAQSHQPLQYKAFHLKENILREFSILSKMEFNPPDVSPPVTVGEINEFLVKYLDSLEIYFHERKDIAGGLVKLKLLELLYNLCHKDKHVVGILLS
jgi:AraC family transcriptional regulator, exoenzyme S synthesis regulatory protein ExsA